MEAYRLRNIYKQSYLFSLQKAFFTTSNGNPRWSASFFNDSEGGSAVYRHALKFKPPTIVKWRENFCNSVSFIGSVDCPLKVCRTGNGRFGVHTMLNVHANRSSDRTPRIMLHMWDELAEISMMHLKPNDFIYVSGKLGSYTKPGMDGELRTYYKVNVKDLNYVQHHGQELRCKKLESEGKSSLEKYNGRLRLWQVFFANPYEWWDNRKQKSNPKSPDFKHKDGAEALWISPNDPPWLKRQLQLYDSRMAGHRQGSKKSHSHLSALEF